MADPADQIASVLDGLHGTGPKTAGSPGFRGHCHGAAAGEVQAVWNKLGGGGGIPEPTMEKDHDRVRAGSGVFRKKQVGLHRTLRTLLIDISCRVFEDLAITRLADGGYSLQYTTHTGGSGLGISRGGSRFVCCEMALVVQSFRA